MKRTVHTLAVSLLFLVGGEASATILTFDTLTPASLSIIPDGYGGLNWNNMGYLDGSKSIYAGSGYNNGLVSGNYVAFNNSANMAMTLGAGSVFDFNGAYLTGAWRDGLNIQVTGLLGGTTLYSQTVVVNSTGPTWFNFDYMGIDELRFNSFGGTGVSGLIGSGAHFVMDNFTFNVNEPVNPIPEPSTAMLLAIGLLGMTSYGYRRSKSA